VITASTVLRDRLISTGTIEPSRITAVGNGLETEAFVSGPTAPPPRDGGTVVYAGNLAAYQRVDLLLEAFAALLRERRRAVLKIYTESRPEPIEAQAQSLGIGDRVEIRSLGFPALSEALAAADVAVNPRPICDGVPQKNLNYMAAGLPLVAFRDSLHPYRDGHSGLAVDTVDAAGLASALADLLARPAFATRLGAAARQLAEDELSWRASGKRVEEVYRHLIA
jgi:glycosyltransferase involved in cell wall biosynthesis